MDYIPGGFHIQGFPEQWNRCRRTAFSDGAQRFSLGEVAVIVQEALFEEGDEILQSKVAQPAQGSRPDL